MGDPVETAAVPDEATAGPLGDSPQTPRGDAPGEAVVVRTVGVDAQLHIAGDPLSLAEVPVALERLKAVRHEALAPVAHVAVSGAKATLTHRVPLQFTPLVDLLDDGEPLSTAEAVQVALPVAEALDVLHDDGLAHGGLSSSHVVLDELARPVLLGVGLAWTDVLRATGIEADRLAFGRWLDGLLDVRPGHFRAVSARRPAARCSDVVAALQGSDSEARPMSGRNDPTPYTPRAPVWSPPDAALRTDSRSLDGWTTPWAAAPMPAQAPTHQTNLQGPVSPVQWPTPEAHRRVDGLPDPWSSAWPSGHVQSQTPGPEDARQTRLRDVLQERRSQIGLVLAGVFVVLALLLMLTGAL